MTLSRRTSEGAPRKIVFSSDQFPANLSDRTRRSLWRDIYEELYGPLDVDYVEDRQFSARLEFIPLGDLGVTRCVSTAKRFHRTRHCVAAAGSDVFHLAVNCGRTPMSVRQAGRDAVLAPGEMALITDALTGEFSAGADNRWLFVTLPRKRLLTLIGSAEDLVARQVDHRQPAVRHLRRYLEILPEPHEFDAVPLLIDHVTITLLDLIALVLDAGRDTVQHSGMRGLRAARLQGILAEISTGYRDPDFSVHTVALRLGLSPRYVQDLLHEAGASFTERVLELRLRKARKMLESRGLDTHKVIDIAYSCGFNEVSYFNRAFRRRFGATPSELRLQRQDEPS